MNHAPDDPVINEELWRTWQQRGKARDRVMARRKRIIFGIVASVLFVAGGAWRLGMY